MEMALAFPHPIADRPYEACSAVEKAFFRETIRLITPFTGLGVRIQISDDNGSDAYRLKAEWKHNNTTVVRTGIGYTPGLAQAHLIRKVVRWSTAT